MKALLFVLIRAFEFELAVPPEDIMKKTTVVQRPLLRSAPEQGNQLPLLVKRYTPVATSVRSAYRITTARAVVRGAEGRGGERKLVRAEEAGSRRTREDLLPGLEDGEAEGALEEEALPPEEGGEAALRGAVRELDPEYSLGGRRNALPVVW